MSWARRQAWHGLRVTPELDALFLEADDGALIASWTRGMEQWLIDRPVSSTPHSQTQTEQDANHR